MAKTDILVTVGANISDFSRKMANVSKTLSNAGKNMSDMGRNLSNIGTQLTNKITKPALAAATAVGGITLAKGFQRLIGIDTARAKLEALGHDAKNVDLIMTNALDAVRGTAYGLDEAATAAASAVAAGIKPGKELAKYLTLVGDSAAIAGTDFNEMASIFNKVQTAQRAYTGDLNMLADRGIPIYQWLAEEAGTSAEAIRDMASRGEVSAEMFRQAIDKNIGGAAKTIGEKSFAAALRNVGADIARIGANFLDAGGEAGGFFSTVKPMITEFRGYLQSLEPRAAELGKKFGEFFIRTVERLKEFKAWWDDLSPAVQNFITKAALIGGVFLVALGPILKIVGGIMSFISLITRVVGVIKSVILFFGGWAKIIAVVKAALAFLISPIGLIIAAVIALAFVIYKYWDEIKAYTVMVWNAIKEFFIELWDSIKEAGLLIWENLKEGWQNAKDNIIEAWESVKEFFANFWDSIVEVFTTAYNWINEKTGGAFGEYVSLIQSYLMTAWEIIKAVWGFIKETFSNVLDFLKSLVSGDFEGMKTAMQKQMNNAKNLLSNIWTAIKENIGKKLSEILSNLITKFSDMVTNTRNKATEIVNTARQKFEEVKERIREKLTEAVQVVGEKIGEMPGKVKEFVSDMIFAGVELIQGLIDGIKTMTRAAIEAITGVVNGVIEKAKSLLKISSPSRLFKQYGQWTGEGLADGITQSIRTVERASERMIDAMMPERKEIDLSYAMPNGITAKSLAGAVSGTVDVNNRDDRLINAIRALERRLTDLEVVMDGEQVGRIVRPHVNEGNALDATVRRYFD